MDVEFVVQDMFALLRPQWKIATTFEEAQQVFSDAVKHNYQTTGSNKQQEEQEEDEEEDGRGIDDVNNDDGEDDKSSGDEAAEPTDDEAAAETPEEDSEDEEEHIIVTRPEDQRDPEADAEFDRELAKMMADSVESRKFDRKPVFDVPLPMRKTATATSTPNSEPSQPIEAPSNTMKFALLSRKGNKPQARLLIQISVVLECMYANLHRLALLTCLQTRTSPLPCVVSKSKLVQSSNASRTWSSTMTSATRIPTMVNHPSTMFYSPTRTARF